MITEVEGVVPSTGDGALEPWDDVDVRVACDMTLESGTLDGGGGGGPQRVF